MKSSSKMMILAAATLAVLALAPNLMAQKGLYFGGSVGPSYINKSITDVDFSNLDIHGNDLSYKIFAGYQLPAFLALEAGYRDLGKVSDNIAQHNSSGWDLNAKATLPLGPLQIFGKAGAFFNNVKVTFNDPVHPDINNSNTKFMFGFGAGINIQRLGLRAEWEALDLEKNSKVSMLTAGITYRLAGGN